MKRGRMAHRPRLVAALLLCLAPLAACTERLLAPPVDERYHLDVAATRASYAPGDSVFIRAANHDSFAYIWHRCPGVLLQRNGANGWDEVPGQGPCTPAFITIAAGSTITIAFELPLAAPVGTYRAQLRLSLIDERPPLFWFPSRTFTVD